MMEAHPAAEGPPMSTFKRKGLSTTELQNCQRAFKAMDKEHSGTISLTELAKVMKEMGQSCSDEELFVMISSIDEDASGFITFSEFLKAVENQKFFNGGLDRQPQPEDESEFVDAFMALGGKADRSGSIELARLMGVLELFELNVEASALQKEADSDASGSVEYAELKQFLVDQNVSLRNMFE